MLRSEKKTFVSDLEEIYQASNSVIITHYHGLTVSELTTLRRSLRENGASFKVVKNTLSKIRRKQHLHNYEVSSFKRLLDRVSEKRQGLRKTRK